MRCSVCVCVYCWPSRYRSLWIDKLTARILETLRVLASLTDLTPQSPYFRPFWMKRIFFKETRYRAFATGSDLISVRVATDFLGEYFSRAFEN